MVTKANVGGIMNDFIEKYILHETGGVLEGEQHHAHEPKRAGLNLDISNFILSFYFKRAEEYRKYFCSKKRFFLSPKRLEKRIFAWSMEDTKHILAYIIEINNQYENLSTARLRHDLNDLSREKSASPFSTYEETKDNNYFANYRNGVGF